MWSEGLFITPQHLQLMDRYHEHLVHHRLEAISPHHWGVFDIDVNLDELARGTYRLDRLGAVMPDGTVVHLAASNPVKGLVAISNGALRGNGQTLGVYLAVPSEGSGGATKAGGSAGARYVEQNKRVSDAFSVAEDVEIQTIQPNIQLLCDEDHKEGYVTLKLNELHINESGRLALSKNFYAPMLQTRCCTPLMDQLSRLVAALASKQKDLVARYGDREAALVEFGAADVATFWYLHTVNTWLPTFMHYSESGIVHPEHLYLALAGFAGQLSTFEAATDPLDLPKYRHDTPGATFVPLVNRVLSLLGTVVSARYTTIPLEQTQPGLFVGRVDDPGLLRRALYLIAGGEIPEEALREDLPRFLKVGSLEQIAHIVQSALPGVGARIDLAPPSAIPVRAHMLYLKLGQMGRYWEAVQQSGTIAIYQPVKPNKVKLELLAIDA
jgi:type VI secretion system protein ImpJ